MDKKQKISWGVSFGSLALVAGMVSYLGLSNGDQAGKQASFNHSQQPNNKNQQSQDSFNVTQDQGLGQNDDNFWSGDSSSQFNQNDPSTSNNFDNGGQTFGNSNQQQEPFFNGGGRSSGHHHGFDTTTGGT